MQPPLLLRTRHGIGYPIGTRKLYCVSSSSLDKRVKLLCKYNEGHKSLKITLYLQGSFTLLSRLELLTQYNFRVQIGYPIPCLLRTPPFFLYVHPPSNVPFSCLEIVT